MNPAELVPQVYGELRKLAAAKLVSEKPGQSLDATALVHEAFLKLGGERSFASRSDYLKAAAQAMRRILVDHARARNSAKRGGGRRVDLETEQLAIAPASRNPQSTTQEATCVDASPPCLHPACTDSALRELVTAWHQMSSEAREKVVRIARDG